MELQNIDMTREERIEILLKRVYMFLEDGEFKRADEFCEQILNLNPECAEAYIGKVMAEYHIRSQDMLKDICIPYYESNNYNRALKFASPELADKLKEFAAQNKIHTVKKHSNYIPFKRSTGLIWSAMGLISFIVMFFDFYECKTSYSGIEACFLEIDSWDFEFYFTPFCIISVLLSFVIILTGLISFFSNKMFKKTYLIESFSLFASSMFILIGHFCDEASHFTRIGMYMHVFWSICIIAYLFAARIISFKKREN